MIHDATGKFSSRCVLPDRNSLAVVIENWLHSLKTVVAHGPVLAHACRSRTPYRGIRYQNQCYMRFIAIPAASGTRWKTASPRRCRKREVLLPVVFQHLIACHGNPRAILLEAGQNYEITLIYCRAAEALNIARAGF